MDESEKKFTTHFTPRRKLERRCFSGSIALRLFRKAAGVETIISGSLTGHPCSQSVILDKPQKGCMRGNLASI